MPRFVFTSWISDSILSGTAVEADVFFYLEFGTDLAVGAAQSSHDRMHM